ncbi:Ig-like domain repeat protein [Isosphaeraceae bacterium EP7]
MASPSTLKYTRNSRAPKPRNTRRRLSFDTLERLQLLSLSVFHVTSVADNGDDLNPSPGSLRAAILQANAAGAGNTAKIDFQIAADGLQTISIGATPLPALSAPIDLDGSTQSTFSGTGPAYVVIDGKGSFNRDGLDLVSGSDGSTIAGLSIVNFTSTPGHGFGSGIRVTTVSNVTIRGNLLGILPDGTAAGNSDSGLYASTSYGLSVLGNTIARNVGNGIGVSLTRNLIIRDNVIFANSGTGIGVGQAEGDASDPSKWNLIESNIVGWTADHSPVGNAYGGISVGGSAGVVIRGNTVGNNGSDGIALSMSPAAVVSGNRVEGSFRYDRLYLANGIAADLSDNAIIRSNYVADNSDDGILVRSSGGVTIGGPNFLADRNIVVRNGGNGVVLDQDGQRTPAISSILSNQIGVLLLDESPFVAAAGNAKDGLVIRGMTGIVVLGNLIRHNGQDGADLYAVSGAVVQNNEIIANAGDGLRLNGTNNTIGGGFANSIGLNGGVGVVVVGPELAGNSLTGNLIASETGRLFAQVVWSTDAGGADVSQTYPITATLSLVDSISTISGTFYGAPNTTYTLEFFHNFSPFPNQPQGPFSIAKQVVTTDASGHAAFLVDSSFGFMLENGVSGIATDASNNVYDFLWQKIGRAETSTSLAPVNGPLLVGQAVTLLAHVNSLRPGLSGRIVFRSGDVALGDAVIDSSGDASFTFVAPATGSYSFTATYNDPSYVVGQISYDYPYYKKSVSAPLDLEVLGLPTTTSLAVTSGPSVAGAPLGFTATVSPTGILGAPTGTVVFKDGETAIGSAAIGAGGVATLTTSALGVGTHHLSAIYLADGYFATSTSGVVAQVVTPSPTATTLVASAGTSPAGEWVSFSASVTSSTLNPAGLVDFYEGSTLLGSASIGANGLAEFRTLWPTVGTHAVVAVYRGDGNSEPSQSSPVDVVITRSLSSGGWLTVDVRSVIVGQPVAIYASFSAHEAGERMTGLISFYDGETLLGTLASEPGLNMPMVPQTYSCNATLTVTSLAKGEHSFRAVYSGDSNFTPAESSMQASVTVLPIGTKTSLTSEPTGTSTRLYARVSEDPSGLWTTGGNVSFYDGPTLLGTVFSFEGDASLDVGPLAPGVHQFRAVYSEGRFYESSNSSLDLTVAGPKVTGLSRYGLLASPTTIVLTFDGPLEPTRAQDPANYRLVDPRGRPVAIVAAAYDSATMTVTLRPARRLELLKSYTLTAVGGGVTGLAGTNGLALDDSGRGTPGTDFSTKITWKALTSPGASPAVVYVGGQETATTRRFVPYVRSVVRASRAMLLAPVGRVALARSK